MSIYRSSSPSPYGPPSPIPPTTPLQPSAPGGQIQPGTITYTTSTSPDGRLTYHPFKAVPVSYQTNSGIVSGIQWIPAEATSVLPTGAQPANAEFVSSWNRGGQNKDDKALREWMRNGVFAKKRKRPQSASDKERERQARERDARAMSGNYSAVPLVANSVGSPYGVYSNPMNDLERRMDGVDLGSARKSSVGEYSNRRRSTYTEAAVNYPAAQLPGSPYQVPMAPPSPVTTASNPGYAPAAGYPTSAYPPSGPGADPYQRAALPYGLRSRAPSPNPGAVAASAYGTRSRAASPIPNPTPYVPPRPRSRAASPLPGAAPPPYSGQPSFPHPNVLPRSPHIGGGATLSYTFFEAMKIQDMDDFYDNMPRMPMVLVPHDVYHEDWIRFIQDLAMAWAGKLPTSEPSRSSRSSAVTAELIDLWNNSFFASRGVEVVLFKGHERRSGQGYGQVERNLPGFGGTSDSDSSDSLSDSSSGSRMTKKKAERKAEKKRKQKEKEKKARRRARERERTYALYITCVAPRDGALAPPY
ncbi:hypothetical protein B0F90DRAFT_1923083 [Multifurca ochricompacta]|uniref:Uncharacterized protein n=1 Tax=Multifurca ochricompacta TaxID=376703 RepID=A0AAD4QSX0_9AGAM|nr:hypothetical protein B0F90DRAFT_1923083 [Multifurca ochricompacta]